MPHPVLPQLLPQPFHLRFRRRRFPTCLPQIYPALYGTKPDHAWPAPQSGSFYNGWNEAGRKQQREERNHLQCLSRNAATSRGWRLNLSYSLDSPGKVVEDSRCLVLLLVCGFCSCSLFVWGRDEGGRCCPSIHCLSWPFNDVDRGPNLSRSVWCCVLVVLALGLRFVGLRWDSYLKGKDSKVWQLCNLPTQPVFSVLAQRAASSCVFFAVVGIEVIVAAMASSVMSSVRSVGFVRRMPHR